jgi:hypothetical protein
MVQTGARVGMVVDRHDDGISPPSKLDKYRWREQRVQIMDMDNIRSETFKSIGNLDETEGIINARKKGFGPASQCLVKTTA